MIKIKQYATTVRGLVREFRPHPDTLLWDILHIMRSDRSVMYLGCWQKLSSVASKLDWWTNPRSVRLTALVGPPGKREYKELHLLDYLEDCLLFELCYNHDKDCRVRDFLLRIQEIGAADAEVAGWVV